MNIFILRHFESEKNISNSMSNDDTEHLTLHGRENCALFSKAFWSFCEKKQIRIIEIDSADSQRARECVEIINRDVLCPNIFFWQNLCSTNAGRLAGKKISEIKSIDPFFYDHYYLYRKGLLNLYYLDEKWADTEKESKKEFEKRVIDCFYNIIKNKGNKNEGILIIAHRASITAILINAVRKLGIYPSNFYGNVEVSLGGLSWISFTDNLIEIHFINETDVEKIER